VTERPGRGARLDRPAWLSSLRGSTARLPWTMARSRATAPKPPDCVTGFS